MPCCASVQVHARSGYSTAQLLVSASPYSAGAASTNMYQRFAGGEDNRELEAATTGLCSALARLCLPDSCVLDDDPADPPAVSSMHQERAGAAAAALGALLAFSPSAKVGEDPGMRARDLQQLCASVGCPALGPAITGRPSMTMSICTGRRSERRTAPAPAYGGQARMRTPLGARGRQSDGAENG